MNCNVLMCLAKYKEKLRAPFRGYIEIKFQSKIQSLDLFGFLDVKLSDLISSAKYYTRNSSDIEIICSILCKI